MEKIQAKALFPIYRFINLLPNSKETRVPGWQLSDLSAALLERALAEGANLGVLTGAHGLRNPEFPGQQLVDVDLDGRLPAKVAALLLPPTKLGIWRDGIQTHHLYLASGVGYTSYNLVDRNGKPIGDRTGEGGKPRQDGIELRSDRHYTMCPPSIHPEGTELSWGPSGPGNPSPAPDIAKRVLLTAVVAQCLHVMPEPGNRQDFHIALAGTLCNSRLFTRDDILHASEALVVLTADEELDKRLDAAGRTYDRWVEGETIVAERRLAELVGQAPVENIRRWFGARIPQLGASGLRGEHLETTSEPLGFNDMGNSHRFADKFGDQLRWCIDTAEWLAFQEGVWQKRGELVAHKLAEQTLLSMVDELKALPLTADSRKVYGQVQRSHGLGSREAMIKGARHLLAVHRRDLDPDPALFNVENGTLDLRTGQLQEFRARDLLTRKAPVRFDPSATCPQWQSFLSRIFRSHPELIGFVQEIAGYTLLGNGNKEQVLFILHGLGANGKTTLLETLRYVLGEDNCGAAPSFVFSNKNVGNNELYLLAGLEGKRLLTISETSQDTHLNEALIKGITGGELISARHPYGASFSYYADFVPFIATNHKPAISGTDYGMWRRLKLVPFAETIAAEEIDTDLPRKLRAEASGILNWMLEGAQHYQRQLAESGSGLRIPAVVLSATDCYRSQQDVLAEFLAECCVFDPAAKVTGGELRKAYEEYCHSSGSQAVNATRFNDCLRQRPGVEKGHGNANMGRHWKGITLKPSAEQ